MSGEGSPRRVTDSEKNARYLRERDLALERAEQSRDRAKQATNGLSYFANSFMDDYHTFFAQTNDDWLAVSMPNFKQKPFSKSQLAFVAIMGPLLYRVLRPFYRDGREKASSSETSE